MQLFTLLAFFQDNPDSSPPAWYSMAPIVFLALIFYFLVLRPQMKQQKQHQKLVADLQKGDKVITSGGLWGEVDEVDATSVRLRVNDKTKIRVSRSAVTGMQPLPGEQQDAK
jgi:preprotein translocase subunit YajC